MSRCRWWLAVESPRLRAGQAPDPAGDHDRALRALTRHKASLRRLGLLQGSARAGGLCGPQAHEAGCPGVDSAASHPSRISPESAGDADHGLKPHAVGSLQSRVKLTSTRPLAGTVTVFEPFTAPETVTVTVPAGTLLSE